MSDTEELWLELADAFAFQAWLIERPNPIPAKWQQRDSSGKVRAVIIGGGD